MELTEIQNAIMDIERQLLETQTRYYKLEGAKEVLQSLLQQESTEEDIPEIEIEDDGIDEED